VRRLLLVLFVLLVLPLAACASPTTRTIEPTVGGAPPDDDSLFVLSRGGAGKTKIDLASLPLHLEEKWWPFRAEQLGISPAEARARDAAITPRRPPDGFWDRQTALETATIWSALCNECHGGRRTMQDALDMPPPPQGWGTGEGLFFGRSRPYLEIFATIHDGGPPRNGIPSEMPKWRGKLSREQIWSLIYFVEYQSGGVEGRFPPSLYPRRSH
jgi:mono/diheme cytochrome c family protein